MIIENIKTFHHRILMKYLQKRGWVVFYLPKENRTCNDMCWLKLSEQQKEK